MFLNNYKSVWLATYVLAIIVLPPLTLNGKSIFWAELLLIPVIIEFLGSGGWRRFPVSLGWVLGALFVAFFTGLFRGQIGHEISPYWSKPGWETYNDAFSLGRDLTRVIRWALLFSTPVLIGYFFRNSDRTKISEFFLRVFTIAAGLSAVVAILEFLGLFPSQIYHSVTVDWKQRSYGTFQSPLEASLIYGAGLVLTIQRLKRPYELIVVALFLCALMTTYGATAMMASLACLPWMIFSRHKTSGKHVALIASIIIFLTLVTFKTILPMNFVLWKFVNFSARFEFWKKALITFMDHPHFFLTGMGFTSLVMDNSFFLLILLGGFPLFIATFLWMKQLLVRSPKAFHVILLFWILSFAALDSIGFWGIGRVCWLLLGINLLKDEV